MSYKPRGNRASSPPLFRSEHRTSPHQSFQNRRQLSGRATINIQTSRVNCSVPGGIIEFCSPRNNITDFSVFLGNNLGTGKIPLAAPADAQSTIIVRYLFLLCRAIKATEIKENAAIIARYATANSLSPKAPEIKK